MKICGVIAEYNPFHNGHQYQLTQARAMSGCDFLMVVMGGAFSQRGEVMMLDKWMRTRMALEHGADMVIELPALFAVRSADMFAAGGIHILSGLGANALSFGCEMTDVSLLHQMVNLLDYEDDAFREALRVRLEQGQSHVRARGEAMAQRLNISPDAIAQPNTSLALEYLRANQKLARPMDIHIVPRTSDYHSLNISAFASASAIRASLSRGEISSLSTAMPPSAFEQMQGALFGRISDMTRLDALLIDRLRTMSLVQLAALCDVTEGLEHRIQSCAEQVGSRSALLSALKCKRYTHARLSRLCAHALLGMTKDLTARHPLPSYARVLGFRRDAKPLLRQVSTAALPLISRPSLLRGQEVFDLEQRATDLQALCFAEESARSAHRDLTEKMVIV